jgi:hypothetical protein
MSDQNHLCHVCNEPVNLQTTNTDEDGKVVHENCYVVQFDDDGIMPTPPSGSGG